ncbi:metal ABC transporter permease [Rhabdothermincola sediminis]|uniref:metal ABC transporter permease n=1 Tax=Rhabdothermincola sediminis TaxID=2751370 RepID=UPI001AA03D49|nr:metal ABC transporter permease [Rhabdothermincola sediminis]
MSWFVDPFTSNEFMQRALLAGVLVAVACAVVGTFVVLRGLAFIGDALAHGVLPGVAAALLLGWPGLIGALAGAIAMIAGVSVVTRHSRLSSDTAIGLLFVGMLALGVVMVSHSRTFTGDIVNILFGEVFGVAVADLWVQAAATGAVVVVALVCARPFLLLSFDPDQAEVSGFRSSRYHHVMLGLIAVTVVVSFQTVGTLLVFGMLLAPAGTGALLAHRIGPMVAWATAIGVGSVYAGLLVSYHWDVAGGAAVVLCAVGTFFAVLAATGVRGAWLARPRARPATTVAAGGS